MYCGLSEGPRTTVSPDDAENKQVWNVEWDDAVTWKHSLNCNNLENLTALHLWTSSCDNIFIRAPKRKPTNFNFEQDLTTKQPKLHWTFLVSTCIGSFKVILVDTVKHLNNTLDSFKSRNLFFFKNCPWILCFTGSFNLNTKKKSSV